jgi:hypothetical protein
MHLLRAHWRAMGMPRLLNMPVTLGVEPTVGIPIVIMRLMALTVVEDQMKGTHPRQADPIPAVSDRLHRHPGPVAMDRAGTGVPAVNIDVFAPAGAALEVEGQVRHQKGSMAKPRPEFEPLL